jgi:hypothetical protein
VTLGVAAFALLGAACAGILGIDPDKFTFSEGGPAIAQDAGSEGGTNEDGSLLAYWSFDDETNGIVPDLTGHHHDGQLGSGASLAPGKDGGQALASTMTVQSLSGRDFPLQGTLSFWLRADFTGQVADVNIFDAWESSRSHLFVRVPNASPFALQVACQIPGQVQFPFGALFNNPASNTWTHVVVSWDAVLYTVAAYVDGNLLAQGNGGALASWTPSDQQFVFASNFPKGLVDDARVYSRVLSAAEVSTIP